MARYAGRIESQTAQPAGLPATTTFNGYIGCVGGGTGGASGTSGFRMRRLFIGVRAGASVPTSQQMSLAIYRQTVIPVGTGITLNTAMTALETWTAADPTGGLSVTTGTTAGTTGPTIGSNPIHELSFNTQSYVDVPAELMEEWITASGTGNGFAFVNIGNALPASHLFTISVEIEV